MDFEKLWEKFDKDILTEDIQKTIVELVENKVNEIQEAYDKKVEKLTENVSVAMDNAFEEVVKEQKELVTDTEKVKEANRILESYKNDIKKFNIDVDSESKHEKEKTELKESYNALQKKYNDEKNQRILAERESKIAKLSEGLTVQQKEDFSLLVEDVEFNDKFDEKINKIKEIVTVSKKDVVKESNGEDGVIVDSDKPKTKSNYVL